MSGTTRRTRIASRTASVVRALKIGLRVLVPLLLLAIGWLTHRYILSTARPPRNRVPARKVLHVEAAALQPGAYQVTLRSRGTVRARTESRLSAEVQGRVVRVADNFRVGARVVAGDVLVTTTRTLDEQAARVDLAEALAERRRAEALIAELVQQQRNVATERDLARKRHTLARNQLARVTDLHAKNVSSQSAVDDAKQAELTARIQWQQLADSFRLLAVKKETAEVSHDLARVKVERGRLALQHIELRAPFDGIVLRRQVEVGEIVTRGAELGALFSTDRVEVRLPLGAVEQEMLAAPADEPPGIVLRAGDRRWDAALTRLEGTVDPATRQLMAIAVVEKPYAGPSILRVGTFVLAEIAGRRFEDVHVVPRALLQPDDVLLVVEGSGKSARVVRRRVEICWRDAEVAVIEAGLQDGDRLCKTPVVFAGDNAPVVVEGDASRPVPVRNAGGPQR